MTEKIIFVICGVLLFVLLSVIILAGISLAEKDSKKASDTIENTLELISVAIPENGEVITGKEWRCASYITIKNIGDKNGYFVLVNSNQEPFYSFFVRNHQIATVPVPNGSYYITCYLGDVGEEWYGKDYMFGNASADCKSEMINSKNSTWEYDVNNNILSQKYAQQVTPQKQPTPTEQALPTPKNGQVFIGASLDRLSKLTIHNSGSNCYIKLKNSGPENVFSFFVRSNETATVSVPQGRYYVYFSSGDEWYGTDRLFGDKTYYSKDDELLDFSEYTWEYTLNPVKDGNFERTTITAEEFK